MSYIVNGTCKKRWIWEICIDSLPINPIPVHNVFEPSKL